MRVAYSLIGKGQAWPTIDPVVNIGPEGFVSECSGASVDRRTVSVDALRAAGYLGKAMTPPARTERVLRDRFDSFRALESDRWERSTIRGNRPVIVNPWNGSARIVDSPRSRVQAAMLETEQAKRVAESQADAWLLAADGHVDRVDVLIEVRSASALSSFFKRVPAPDAVAYRGVKRYVPLTSRNHGCVQRCATHPGECQHVRYIAAQIDPETGYGRMIVEYRTDVLAGEHFAFIGHHRIADKVNTVKVRKARQAKIERRGQPARTGRPVKSSWTCSPRSLANRWVKADQGARDLAHVIETILRTSAHDSTVAVQRVNVPTTLAWRGYVDVDVSVSEVLLETGERMGIRDYARRAALAGVVPD